MEVKSWAGGLDGRADESHSRVVLHLSASMTAMPPSGPSSLLLMLHTFMAKRRGEMEGARAVRVHAVGTKGLGGWF